MSENPTETAAGTPQAEEGTIEKPAQPTPEGTPEGGSGAGSSTPTKPADETTKTDGTTERIVPEKYDLKMSDGAAIDPKHLDAVIAYAKENNLTNEEAQKVLDRDNGLFTSFVETQKEQLAQATQKWASDAKIDKEIGGDAFVQNVELAKRVIEKFGSDLLKTDLDKTGLGNHPEMVRLLVRIGKTMSEDQFVPAGSQSGAKRSTEEVFYGKPTENKGE